MRWIRFFKADLAREARDWVEQGLLEPDQAEAILAQYGVSLDGQAGRGMGVRVLMALAVLFFGLSLLVLMGYNWQQIPPLVRVLGLVGLTLALNVAAMRQWWRGRDANAVLWWFGAGLAYGIAIMLIAQIYHLGGSTFGIFLWALGILPLAVLTGSRLLHLLQLSLASLWMVQEFEVSIPWAFVLFAIPAIVQVFRGRISRLLLLLSLAATAAWINGVFLWWLHPAQRDPDLSLAGLNAGLALLAWGLCLALAESRRDQWQYYARVLQAWLLRAVVIVLLCLSFGESWDLFLDEWREQAAMGITALAVAVGILLVGMMRLSAGARRRLLAAVLPTVAIFALATFGLSPVAMAVLVNLILLVLAMGAMHQGLQTGQTQLFYTGVSVVLLLALLRYFDLIGGYIGAAVMFALAGVVMIGAARFWHRRMAEQEAS